MATRRLGVIATIVSAGLASTLSGQIHRETSGPTVIVSPEHFAHRGDGLDILRGTFYNAAGVASPSGTEYFLYAQGGMFQAQDAPWQWCAGDNIILFKNPNTSSGLRSPFRWVKRVSPCNPSVFHHYGVGSVLRDNTTGKYYLLADEVDSGASFPNGDFKTVLLGESADGVNWDWDGNLNVSNSPTRTPFVKASNGIYVVDVTLVYAPGSDSWWGTFTFGTSAANLVGRMKVFRDATNPRGFVVWVLSGGVWRTINDDGSFGFTPDNEQLHRVPQPAIVSDDGRWEWWAVDRLSSAAQGCNDGNSTTTSTFSIQRVFPGGDLVTTVETFATNLSLPRAAPSINGTGLLYPHRYNDPSSSKLLYSSSTDRVCSNPVTRQNWLNGPHSFIGMEIVVTTVDN